MAARAPENFGKNLRFEPARWATPRDEAELLVLLDEGPHGRFRAVGSLHSWSPAACTDGVAVDLHHLDHVEVVPEEGLVRVGAGCTMRRLVAEMNRKGMTLPSMGLIRAQTVAGATSTGTHGSGKSSLSHYVRSVRVAVFDPHSGRATIRVVDRGAELQALRCGLGCLGIVTELTLEARPQYRIREVFHVHPDLETVLAAERRWPLQQFYLVPWDWRFYAQHRAETRDARSWSAPLYRLYWIVVLDLGLHIVIRALVRTLRWSAGVRGFFRWFARGFAPRGWSVVDRSEAQLTMHHDWFRHIEFELFVESRHMKPAIEFVKDALVYLSGTGEEDLLGRWGRASTRSGADPRAGEGRSDDRDWVGRASEVRGRYTHHYPICVRKVDPDDTLLSMTANRSEPSYAISFISYARPEDREVFLAVADTLTEAMGELFGARPHWGKVCPWTSEQVRASYPTLGEFLAVRDRLDPDGRFGNSWSDGLLRGRGEPGPTRPGEPDVPA